MGLNALCEARRGSLGPARSADATPGLGWSGRLTVARVLEALDALPAQGSVELVAHPGETSAALEARYRWGYDWSGETDALCAPELAEGLAARGFELTRFTAMAA